MADEATSSITIDAGKGEVMAVIADFGAYPEWAKSIKSAEVLEDGGGGRAKQVRFEVDAGIMKDEYTLEYDWSGDDRVSWHLVEGKAQKAQQGSYTLTEAGGATDVTYHLEVELNIRIPGLLKRKAEKMIIDTALKDLKKRVEG